MVIGSSLRSHINRHVSILGDGWKLDTDHRSGLLVTEGKLLNEDGKVMVDGRPVRLESSVSFQLRERVAFVRPHPKLYDIALVHTQLMYDPSDGTFTPYAVLVPNHEFDITTLPWVFKLHLTM